MCSMAPSVIELLEDLFLLFNMVGLLGSPRLFFVNSFLVVLLDCILMDLMGVLMLLGFILYLVFLLPRPRRCCRCAWTRARRCQQQLPS